MKPFYIKKLINKNIFDWNDFDFLLKNHPREFLELIDKNGNKIENISKNENFNEKNIIFNNTYNYKKEFFTLKEFFKLKVPELNNYKKWDVHIYTGHENNCRSFGPHFDIADNFIIQVQGKSRWVVSHSFDIILEPYDVIFVPKYWVHECIPLGKRISLSFAFWY